MKVRSTPPKPQQVSIPSGFWFYIIEILTKVSTTPPLTVYKPAAHKALHRKGLLIMAGAGV